jgi:hypothetical protein
MFHAVKPSGSGILVLEKQGMWLFKGAQVEAERALPLAILERKASYRTCQLGRYVPRAKKVMYTEHIFALARSTWLINVQKCEGCTSISVVPRTTFQASPQQRKHVSRLRLMRPDNGRRARSDSGRMFSVPPKSSVSCVRVLPRLAS